jgi:hypothetical protein
MNPGAQSQEDKEKVRNLLLSCAQAWGASFKILILLFKLILLN